MKKIRIFLPILLLSIVATACSGGNQVGEKEVKGRYLEDGEKLEEKIGFDIGEGQVVEMVKVLKKTYGIDNINSLKLKNKKNDRVYEVKGYDDEYEYEYVFNSKGKLIKKEKEMMDMEDRYENNPFTIEDMEGILSYEEIIDIVSKETDSYIESVKLKKGLKGLVYDIDTEGRVDLDIIIDAISGEILYYDD